VAQTLVLQLCILGSDNRHTLFRSTVPISLAVDGFSSPAIIGSGPTVKKVAAQSTV
jgi:hypothetical protein